jgi:uncharacterized membrane protein
MKLQMKQDQLLMVLLLIVMSPGVALSISVLKGNLILAFGILLSVLAAIYLSRSRIDNLKEDGRFRQISQKASWDTFLITVLGFAFGGAAFIAIGDIFSMQMYTDKGIFMAYVSEGVLLIYTFLYILYNKKKR